MLPYRNTRVGIKSAVKPRSTAKKLALENYVSSRKASSNARALSDAVNTFSNLTGDLHQSLNSFEFFSGTVSRYTRTASASDSEKVSARAAPGATVENYFVEVDQLAAAQTNRSEVLVSDETTDLDEGTYIFTLTVDDSDYSFSVTIDKTGSSPDTNKDVLRKLAWAIGNADESIEAAVTETERKVYSTLSDGMTEEVSYLTIRSSNSGDSTSFSLSDDTGTMVDTLKLDQKVQSGMTGQYLFNGTASSTTSNTVSLDSDRLTLTFLDTTADPILVRVQEGLTPLEEKLGDLISSYNSYISWLDQNSRYITSGVKAGIIKEIEPISDDLKAIGLQFDANGKLNSTDKFSSTLLANIGNVRETLTGDDGFFTKVETKPAAVLENGAGAYSLDQDHYTVYSRRGIADVIFSRTKRSNELSLYA